MLLPGGDKKDADTENIKWTADPGLPVDNPTVPMWQVPLHELANVSSSSLPESADVVIIGSGMSGCSVAKTILEGDDKLKVVVLEARGLASGASSRNGGHIVSPSFADFPKLVETLGREMAVKVALFTHDNCEQTFQMVDGLADPSIKEKSEIRRTQKVIVLKDESIVAGVQSLIKTWNETMPGEWCLSQFVSWNSNQRDRAIQRPDEVDQWEGGGGAVWLTRCRWCLCWRRSRCVAISAVDWRLGSFAQILP